MFAREYFPAGNFHDYRLFYEASGRFIEQQQAAQSMDLQSSSRPPCLIGENCSIVVILPFCRHFSLHFNEFSLGTFMNH